MQCSKCGNNNAEDSKFCQYCGSALISAASEMSDEQLTQFKDGFSYQNQNQAQNQNQNQFQSQTQTQSQQQDRYAYYQQYRQPYNASRTLPNVLVWGILSFALNFIGFSLLSIVFGIVGISNAKQYKRIAGELDNSASTGNALSIVGLILGALITLAVIAIVVFAVIVGLEAGFDESFIEYYSVFMRTFNI